MRQARRGGSGRSSLCAVLGAAFLAAVLAGCSSGGSGNSSTPTITIPPTTTFAGVSSDVPGSTTPILPVGKLRLSASVASRTETGVNLAVTSSEPANLVVYWGTKKVGQHHYTVPGTVQRHATVFFPISAGGPIVLRVTGRARDGGVAITPIIKTSRITRTVTVTLESATISVTSGKAALAVTVNTTVFKAIGSTHGTGTMKKAHAFPSQKLPPGTASLPVSVSVDHDGHVANRNTTLAMPASGSSSLTITTTLAGVPVRVVLVAQVVAS